MGTHHPSTFSQLREGLQHRFEAALQQRVQATLAAHALAGGCCEVWLFGSRARGDWDGFSDTDLLVVADGQDQADQMADALLDAGLGADVIALSRIRWQAMASSDSPHWRSIHRQARQLLSFGP